MRRKRIRDRIWITSALALNGMHGNPNVSSCFIRSPQNGSSDKGIQMNKFAVICLFAIALPAVAAEADTRSSTDRYVADDIEIETRSNGEVVTRLVSRNGVAARQFWTNSVYPQKSIVVFQGRGGVTRNASGSHDNQKNAWQRPQNDRAAGGVLNFQQLVPDRYVEQKKDAGFSR